MSDFSFDELDFKVITGEVHGKEQYVYSTINSQGGEVDFTQQKVRLPTIESSVTDYQEFWVKPQMGFEEFVKIEGDNIPIRNGQIVSLLSVSRDGMSKQVTLINHSSGKEYPLNTANRINNYFNIRVLNIKPIIYGFIFGATNYIITKNFALAWVPGAFLCMFLYVDQLIAVDRTINALKLQIDKCICEIKSNRLSE
ncbi:hypothetical protein [Photobacterium sanguinicancri]|uniref:hypothetical protein n=1 Tax=Photobacterium sanguinicancri TaxID=875932 RepID=UPI0024815DF8|nr:hypothetical protein [Photobacterium sanguinicancri]